MYTFIILLLICASQGGFFYWKWSEIQEYRGIGKDVAAVTGLDNNKRYSAFIRIAGRILGLAKYLLFILVPVIFVVDFIVALVLGSILHLIISFM